MIIAYGNSLRRDDGAGQVLGEMLERAWRNRNLEVQRIAVHQLAPELAESVAATDVTAVVFVDARVADSGAGSLDVEVHPVADAHDSPSLGHHLDPSVLMVYARLLFGKEPPAWLVSVPGVDFDHGEGLSEIAVRAIGNAGDLLSMLPQDWPISPPSPAVIL